MGGAVTTEGTLADVLAGTARWSVICADSLDVLPTLADGCVDHVITDPPYDEKTNAGARTDATAVFGVAFAAFSPPFGAVHFSRLAKRWAIAFCSVEMLGAYAASAGPSWVRAAVWDKIAPSPQLTGDRPGQAVEGVAVMHRPGRKRWNGGGCAGIWRHLPPHGSNRPDHPTPKPLRLMEELVTLFTDPGDLILDPFCGSGTTGAACLRLGRRVILIEREPRWADLSRERLRAEEQNTTLAAVRAGQMALFGGDDA